MWSGDRLRLGAAVTSKLGPDSGEGEQRPIAVQCEPYNILLACRWVGLRRVLGEFVDTPDAVFLDNLARRIERQAIEATQGINLTPVLANILILKSDVIGPVG